MLLELVEFVLYKLRNPRNLGVEILFIDVGNREYYELINCCGFGKYFI